MKIKWKTINSKKKVLIFAVVSIRQFPKNNEKILEVVSVQGLYNENLFRPNIVIKIMYDPTKIMMVSPKLRLFQKQYFTLTVEWNIKWHFIRKN